MWKLSSSLWLFLVAARRITAANPSCERLKRSLTYTQEEAPRDLSGVLPVVVARVNQVLEGVVNVEVGYHGDDLQGKVGEHLVKCEVTRLASALPDDMKDKVFEDDMGREVVSQCFEVPFTILDTNECTLPLHHPLRHQCQKPSFCVNTNGSYDCVCPKMTDGEAETGQVNSRSLAGSTVDDQFWVDLQAEERGPWEVAYNSSSRSSCVSRPSTHGCCPVRANTKDAMLCRSSFRCPTSPCASSSDNDCADRARCVLNASPNTANTYDCQCPTNMMGNGHKCRPGVDPNPEPKVRFDGVTPTEETMKNNFYCDCTVPIVDACSGFPPCRGKHEVCVVTASNTPQCGCKAGYVMHEKYGCVDESPPLMKLRNDPNGDHILRLKQGDIYTEDAVDIQDANAEEYMRSLKIAYSIPMPYGCLTRVGEFHVNYTIATPWTSPSFVRLTRRVIIEDIDECSLDRAKYEKECPVLIPKCDTEAGAKCVNKIGSYTCQCPQFTSGDGFLSGLSFNSDEAVVPFGFGGGTGCSDTSKPVVELNGPNPKVFRTAQCGALSGIMVSKHVDHDADLKAAQQKYYGDDVAAIIRRTSGAELCATHDVVRPNASDCVTAYDDTFRGRVDLSKQVVVGDPVQTSMLQWRVPYNVMDASGNKAETVWRDVVVQEVDLSDMEVKIRSEMVRNKDAEINKAVQNALAEERRKVASQRPATKTCPKCPVCDCSKEKVPDMSICESVCASLDDNTCKPEVPGPEIKEMSNTVKFVIWLESFLPSAVLVVVLVILALFTVLMVFSALVRLYLSAPTYAPVYNAAEREQGLHGQITVFSPQQQQQFPAQNGAALFSPQQQLPPQNGPTNNFQSTNGLFSPSTNYSAGATGHHGPPTASSSIYGTSSSQVFGSATRSPGLSSPAGFQTNASMGEGSVMGQQQPPIDIYQRSPNIIITPSKRGDGVRRRSPYGR